MSIDHDLRVLPSATAAADAAAEVIASLLNEALDRSIEAAGIEAAGNGRPDSDEAGGPPRASVAFSGGSSPRPMLARLAELGGRSLGTGSPTGLDWDVVDVFQVDERVAPDSDPSRNLVDLARELTQRAVPPERLHTMPVELGADQAAADYAATLVEILGPDPRIDVVHLGLGDDGHTASLVPGDAALRVLDRDVAATGDYKGHRRVTLTYPALDRAGTVVWLVAGAGKAEALAALLAGDLSIPASHVCARRSIIIADAAAAARA